MHSVFGIKHLIILAVCAVTIVGGWFFVRKQSLSAVFKKMLLIGIVSELIKVFYYTVTNEEVYGGILPKTDLPFHLCSGISCALIPVQRCFQIFGSFLTLPVYPSKRDHGTCVPLLSCLMQQIKPLPDVRSNTASVQVVCTKLTRCDQVTSFRSKT